MDTSGVTTTANGGPKVFTGKHNREDFTGQNLSRAIFRGCSLNEANFTGCNLAHANFEGANCWGAIFTDANLHRANFKDAILANAKLDAKDMFGMTLTMDCNSVNNTKVGNFWWAFLFLATMMRGPDEIAADKLIALMGKERYIRYSAHFQSREL